jgi:superfamily II DNA helicase RecQ
MSATAYKLDRRHIKESLGLHNCFELVANSDRKNIFYIRKGIHADTGTDIEPWKIFADRFMLQCMQNTMFMC